MAVEDLRRWTSSEALGDITVLPDNTSKIAVVEPAEGEAKDEVDHLLPSPEEQMMAVAMKFPPSIVAVDISGKAFDRMSVMRRSLMIGGSTTDDVATRRRVRRRHRGKRRNTIAGTSQKEIEQAIAGETATETEGCEFEPLPPLRSKSTDLFKMTKTTLSPTDNLKNHFNTLKNWSKTKLKFMNKNTSMESCKPSFQGTDVVDDIGIYETVTSNSKQRREKDRKQSSSSSAISIPASTSSIATSLVVKLRENSLQRRHRRKGSNKGQDEPAHSSSGNWSASSESGRTSIASETTAAPKSSTTTSSNSLNHNGHHPGHHHPPPSVQSRRRYLNTSTSSSVSEGTLTPDINEMQFHDLLDGETSSVYSCDTEGYYTSFHMDSGLKTLKEEEAGLSFSTLQLQEDTTPSTTTFNNTSSSGASTVKTNQLTAESEYELFGRGSTSTTTSSAGTVCTTLLAGNGYGSTRSLSQFAPAVPERKSSLERKTEKKCITQRLEQNEIQLVSDNLNENNDLEKTSVIALIHDSPSPDSGHNTSSSPAESTSQNSHSPNEHLEFSESDLESCDRTERIRTKTEMTTCRIPSMCLITPPQSDDEVNLRFSNQVPCGFKYVPYEALAQPDVLRSNQKGLNGRVSTQTSNGKPLHIKIPNVLDLKKDVQDIYAYPDKSKKKKSDTIKTVSKNGILETNIDSMADEAKDSLHLVVNGETGYATIMSGMRKNERSPPSSNSLLNAKGKEEMPRSNQPVVKPSLLPSNFLERFREVVNKQKRPDKKLEDGDYVMIVDSQSKSPKTDAKHSTKEENKSEYVSLNEIPAVNSDGYNPMTTSNDSLERKKRMGARVTLDSEGKVVYSSDSLKRKKQHTTFVPGKFVRDSPTPSPLATKRMPKVIRPVNCTGLIRTNSEDRRPEDSTMSPQTGKVIIRAGSRSCESPSQDFVRMPPSRVVVPNNIKRKNDKGVRVSLENGEVKNRSASPASSKSGSLERRQQSDRSPSAPSAASSLTDTKKSQMDLNPEEGKILNETDLDDLGENLGCDFFSHLDSIKLNVSLTGCSLSSTESNPMPDIFKIEPEPTVPKKQIKRSDSYRMANHSLSPATDSFTLGKLTTVAESTETESTKSKLKIPVDDPNYDVLVTRPDRNRKQNLRINPNVFNGYRSSPYRVTKPVDTEIAKVLSKTIPNDTEIW
ncbi:hypothetical protein RUM43_001036 [Polyplax serrata]|uniref:WASP family protein member n=1 Tax=Polyplax serrata TaxID=468196 RepID=A0AAN8SD75_POLSC